MKNRSVFLASALLLAFGSGAPAMAQQIVTFQSEPIEAPAWYYCSNPAGYYPMVPRCTTAWQRLPVATTPVPAATIVPSPQPLAAVPVSQIMAPVPAPTPPMAQRQQAFYAMPANNLREEDDRKLNSLAVEFSQIDLSSPDAAARIEELEARVGIYRAALQTHGYNAADIIADTDNLQHRLKEAAARFALPIAPGPLPTPTESEPGATGNPLSIVPMEEMTKPGADEAPAPLAAPVPQVTEPAAAPGPAMSL